MFSLDPSVVGLANPCTCWRKDTITRLCASHTCVTRSTKSLSVPGHCVESRWDKSDTVFRQCDTYTRMGLRLGASLANFSVVTVWHMIAPRSSWIAPQRIALWLHHAVAFSRMHFPSGFFLFMDLAFSWIWWVCRELARRVGAPSDTPMTNHYSVVVPARCCQSSGRWFDSVCQPSRVARLLWFIWLTVETVNP